MEKSKKLDGLYKVLISAPDGTERGLTFSQPTSASMVKSTSATAADIGYVITDAQLNDFQKRLEALEDFARKQEQGKTIVTNRVGAELNVGVLKLQVSRETTKKKLPLFLSKQNLGVRPRQR